MQASSKVIWIRRSILTLAVGCVCIVAKAQVVPAARGAAAASPVILDPVTITTVTVDDPDATPLVLPAVTPAFVPPPRSYFAPPPPMPF